MLAVRLGEAGVGPHELVSAAAAAAAFDAVRLLLISLLLHSHRSEFRRWF